MHHISISSNPFWGTSKQFLLSFNNVSFRRNISLFLRIRWHCGNLSKNIVVLFEGSFNLRFHSIVSNFSVRITVIVKSKLTFTLLCHFKPCHIISNHLGNHLLRYVQLNIWDIAQPFASSLMITFLFCVNKDAVAFFTLVCRICWSSLLAFVHIMCVFKIFNS